MSGLGAVLLVLDRVVKATFVGSTKVGPPPNNSMLASSGCYFPRRE